MIDVYSTTLNYSVPLSCTCCGKRFESKHRFQCDERLNASSLELVLKNDFRNRTPNIPIGWTMNGRDDIRCEACA